MKNFPAKKLALGIVVIAVIVVGVFYFYPAKSHKTALTSVNPAFGEQLGEKPYRGQRRFQFMRNIAHKVRSLLSQHQFTTHLASNQPSAECNNQNKNHNDQAQDNG